VRFLNNTIFVGVHGVAELDDERDLLDQSKYSYLEN